MNNGRIFVQTKGKKEKTKDLKIRKILPTNHENINMSMWMNDE